MNALAERSMESVKERGLRDHSRIEYYKGREIRVMALPPSRMEGYRGKYEIRHPGSFHNPPVVGVIVGGFKTARDAEDGAVQAARHSIDH